MHQISAEDVAALYSQLSKYGIEAWIDGGWGVDALLGKQTRPHGDLDLIIQEKDAKKLRNLLEKMGYATIKRDDYSETNFHMGDEFGREVDFTAIVFDEAGNGIYGPPEKGEMNPAASFKGTGIIAGLAVRCVSLEYVISFRTGYELREVDYHDVAALCERFGLDRPTNRLDGINYQRVLVPADLSGLQNISAEFKGHPFGYSSKNQNEYGKKLNDPHAFQLIVRDGDGTASGFIGASETIFPDYLFIYELLVDQKAQGQKLGKSLVEKAITFAREESLRGICTETEIWNLPAETFYEKCGFVEINNPYWTGGPTYRIDF